jgi:DNA-binding transcriptional LysR family regulator
MEHLPRLHDLAVLVAVARAGSLTGAARDLGLPKSTVSRRLERLERELSGQLVARSDRDAKLTPLGVDVLGRAENLLRDAADLRDAVAGIHAVPRGPLRVSAPADLELDTQVWLSFLDAYPQVELRLSFSNRYVRVVEEGFDLALRGGPGDDPSLVARRVGAFGVVAVASPAWRDAHGWLDDPSALMRVDCILHKPLTGGSPKAEGVRHLVLDGLPMVLAACVRGHGVAILTERVARPELDAGRLVPVLRAFNPLVVPLFAAYPRRRQPLAALQAFLDHVAYAYASDMSFEERND